MAVKNSLPTETRRFSGVQKGVFPGARRPCLGARTAPRRARPWPSHRAIAVEPSENPPAAQDPRVGIPFLFRKTAFCFCLKVLGQSRRKAAPLFLKGVLEGHVLQVFPVAQPFENGNLATSQVVLFFCARQRQEGLASNLRQQKMKNSGTTLGSFTYRLQGNFDGCHSNGPGRRQLGTSKECVV